MKYTIETEINAPREKVAELAGNPDNWQKWMEGLKSYEHMSGTLGAGLKVGSKYRVVFKTGNVEMEFIAEVALRNLPDEMRMTMDASNLFAATASRFIALASQKTTYVSEQDFRFKGVFNKLVGFVLQREFKKQTLQHMKNFKRFAEK